MNKLLIANLHRESYEDKDFSSNTSFILKQLLIKSSIPIETCDFTTILGKKPRFNIFEKGTVSPLCKSFIDRWSRALKKQNKYKLILSCGKATTKILTGEDKFENFRGTLLDCILNPEIKVIPIYSPEDIRRDYKKAFITSFDLQKAHAILNCDAEIVDHRNLIVNPPVNVFMDYLTFLTNSKEVTHIAFDIETAQPGSHITWIGLGHEKNHVMNLKFISNRTPVISERVEFEVWNKLSTLFSSGKNFIAHNMSYDISVLLKNHGILCDKMYFDTMFAAHTLYPELPKNLAFQSSIHLIVPAWKHSSAFDMGTYNAEDVSNTFGLYEVLKHRLEKQELMEIFLEDMKQIPLISFLGLRGIKVDREKQQALLHKTNKAVMEVETKLHRLLNRTTINFRSPKQLQELLYIELKLPRQYKKNAKHETVVTTDEEALKKLYIKHPIEILKLLLEYRTLTKTLDFIDIELEPDTDRVYTSYNPTGTGSGRWSSSKSIILPFGSGNLQNIPQVARNMYIGD